MMKIKFYGAAREVTGSKHLLIVNGKKILLDCGMFQGRRKEAQTKNEDVKNIGPVDVVILSHAHIDHSGLLPLLVKNGFKGPIYSTFATRDLCNYMLLDSAYIQERELEYLNTKLATRAEMILEPLYTMADAEECMTQFVGINYEKEFDVVDGVKCVFHDTGHILGSASVELKINDHDTGEEFTFLFTGDLGRKNMPILKNPVQVENADYMISECTYGNRFHESFSKAGEELEKVVKETAARGGKVIIPAFAVERVQEIVYELNLLFQEHRLPELQIFVDSPLAVNVTDVFKNHPECFDKEIAEEFLENNKNPFGFGRLKYIRDVAESKALSRLKGPCIIMSASGMCEYGRILHHLKHNIEDPKNTILIVGYQAENTLGRKILEKSPEVNILGETYRLKAHVHVMDAFSGHADRSDLIDYIAHVNGVKKIFLVHGEEGQGFTFKSILEEEGYKNVIIPKLGEEFEL